MTSVKNAPVGNTDEVPAGQRVLVESRDKVTSDLLIGVLFTASGVWFIASGGSAWEVAVGVIGVVFFGVLGIPALTWGMLHPRRLTLDDDGFELTTSMFGRPQVRRWVDCGPFTVWRPALGSSGVVYATTHADKRALRVINRGLSGGDEIITSGLADLSAIELAKLMNEYRNRSLAKAAQEPPSFQTGEEEPHRTE